MERRESTIKSYYAYLGTKDGDKRRKDFMSKTIMDLDGYARRMHEKRLQRQGKSPDEIKKLMKDYKPKVM